MQPRVARWALWAGIILAVPDSHLLPSQEPSTLSDNVRIRLVDGQGRPLAGARLHLAGWAELEHWRAPWRRPPAWGAWGVVRALGTERYSDHNGQVDLGVATEFMTIAIQTEQGITSVTWKPGGPREFTVEPRHTWPLSIQVLGPGSKPVPSAWVQLHTQDESHVTLARTDESGGCRFWLRPEQWDEWQESQDPTPTVELLAGTRKRVLAEVDTSQAGPGSITLSTPSLAHLSVQAYPEWATPLLQSPISMALRSAELGPAPLDRWEDRVVPSPVVDGIAHFLVEPGFSYWLVALGKAGMEFTIRSTSLVEIPDSGWSEERLEFPALSWGEGRLVDPRGSPIVGADLVLRAPERAAGALPFSSTDQEGRFHWAGSGRGLMQGGHLLKIDVESPWNLYRSKLLLVDGGLSLGENDLGTIVMDEYPLLISGRVLGAGAFPAKVGVHVRHPNHLLLSQDLHELSRRHSCEVDAEGRFWIHADPSDHWGALAEDMELRAFAWAGAPSDQDWSSRAPLLGASDWVAVGTSDLTVELQPSAVVTGSVRADPDFLGNLYLRIRSGDQTEHDYLDGRSPNTPFSFRLMPGQPASIDVLTSGTELWCFEPARRTSSADNVTLLRITEVHLEPGSTTRDPRLNPLDLHGRISVIQLTCQAEDGLEVPGLEITDAQGRKCAPLFVESLIAGPRERYRPQPICIVAAGSPLTLTLRAADYQEQTVTLASGKHHVTMIPEDR